MSSYVTSMTFGDVGLSIGGSSVRKTDRRIQSALTRKQLVDNYDKTVSKTKVNDRPQSMQYYRTKYHNAFDTSASFDPSLPEPRPPTANSRYRTWKTWLADQLEQKQAASGQITCQSTAFADWLDKKRRFNHQCSQQTSDSARDLADGDDTMADRTAAEHARLLHDFLQRNRQRLLQRRQQTLSNAEGSSCGATSADESRDRRVTITDKPAQVRTFGEHKRVANSVQSKRYSSAVKVDKRVGVFRIGCPDNETDGDDFDATPLEHSVEAYGNWKRDKTRFDSARLHRRVAEVRNLYELEGIRRKLLLEGITYEEWVGYKCMEKGVSPPETQR